MRLRRLHPAERLPFRNRCLTVTRCRLLPTSEASSFTASVVSLAIAYFDTDRQLRSCQGLPARISLMLALIGGGWHRVTVCPQTGPTASLRPNQALPRGCYELG